MIAVRNERYFDKLRKRRTDVARTLAHVRKEHRTVEENRTSIDKAAYTSRCDLLGSLEHWYLDESRRIDDALIRFAEGRYGDCLRCGAPIEPHRLEAAPDAALCAACDRSGANEAINRG